MFLAGGRRGVYVASAIALTAVFGLTLLAYWGVLRAPFHFDDSLIIENPQLVDPGGLSALLSPAQTRQLTYLTFFLNYRLGGANPVGYHAVSLLLHLLNSLLVFVFAAMLTEKKEDVGGAELRRLVPILAAGIFALHPIQSEAVNYIYQRSTLLAALFSLLALCLFFRSEKAERGATYRVLAVLLWLLAALSKESAWILPVILVAHLWARSGNFGSFKASLRRSRWFIGAIATMMLAGVGWVWHNVRAGGDRTIGPLLFSSSLHYLMSQVQVFMAYLRLLIWPAGLSIDHDFRAASLGSLYGIYCLLVLIGLLTLIIRLRASRPMVSFLCVSFLILLAPTSSIIPTADLMFEHRLYLPMIAASILLAWGIIGGCAILVKPAPIRQAACWGIIAVLLVGYAALSRQRTLIWGNDVSLWADAVAKAPDKARAHFNLGVAYLRTDREQARKEFLAVTRLSTDHSAALYNLGWIEEASGRYGTAESYFLAAVKADYGNWRAHQNLGNLYALKGENKDAANQYQEAIRTSPTYWPAYQSLATLLLRENDAAGALAILRRLKELRPDLLEAEYLNAYALVESRRYKEAEAALKSIETRDGAHAYGERIEELRHRMSSKKGEGSDS